MRITAASPQPNSTAAKPLRRRNPSLTKPTFDSETSVTGTCQPTHMASSLAKSQRQRNIKRLRKDSSSTKPHNEIEVTFAYEKAPSFRKEQRLRNHFRNRLLNIRLAKYRDGTKERQIGSHFRYRPIQRLRRVSADEILSAKMPTRKSCLGGSSSGHEDFRVCS